MAALILYLHLRDLYATVAEHQAPRRRGEPVVVSSQSGQRGVVLSCNATARHFGVMVGMPIGRARRRCPRAFVTTITPAQVQPFLDQVWGHLRRLTGRIEQATEDSFYADMSRAGPDVTAVRRRVIALHRDLEAATGLSIAMGLAANKLVARLAALHADTDALTVVAAGQEGTFLDPLPIVALPGIGSKQAAEFEAYGLQTLGALAQQSSDWLYQQFGLSGLKYQRLARGEDAQPLQPTPIHTHLTEMHEFSPPTVDGIEVQLVLRQISQALTSQLADQALVATVITLNVVDAVGTSRGRRMRQAGFSLADDVYQQALYLWQKQQRPDQAVQSLTLSLRGLRSGPVQTSFLAALPVLDVMPGLEQSPE